jgi:hypothetical protein
VGLEAALASLRHNRASYALCTDLDLERARDLGEGVGPEAAIDRLLSQDSTTESAPEEVHVMGGAFGGAYVWGKGGGAGGGVFGRECEGRESVDALG